MGISAMDWAKGIILSIIASIIGGVSKLAIRKSWLMQAGTNSGRRVRSEDGPFTADDNLLSTEGPGDIGNENFVSRDGEEQHFVPRAIRYSGMFGMSVLNPICCVLAMNYASPSILAPFSGLTLVWVILFSPVVNNEKPSSRQVLACCLIICGEVIVAIFGDHTNDEDVTVEDVVSSSDYSIVRQDYLNQKLPGPKHLSSLTTIFCLSLDHLTTSLGFQEKILQQTRICHVFLGVSFICYVDGLLDQFFRKLHSSTVCMGMHWWCHHRNPEFLEGQLNNHQSLGWKMASHTVYSEFIGRYHCLCWPIIPDSLYEKV